MRSLRQQGALAVYSALLRLAAPGVLLRWWYRSWREPLYRLNLPARWGYRLPTACAGSAASSGPCVWIHAVSLGETRAAAALWAALRERLPQARLVLTHGTATGREAGAQWSLRPEDVQTWLPYDTPGAVRRFLRHYRPDVGVLMETEVWPNLLQACWEARIPVVLANARLSERSGRKAQRWPALVLPAVQQLQAVLAQSADDAIRLGRLGARGLQVCGNLKFDMKPVQSQQQQGAQWRLATHRPVVVAASTREGEEAPLLRLWQQALRERIPTAGPTPLLIIVPRHPQRFDEVADLMASSGLAWRRRAEWASTLPSWAQETDTGWVWLGDSLGEMTLYYSMAHVALLGGSFEPFGGQNLIEAAACGCPVIMGPHTYNFAQASQQALDAGAAVRVDHLAGAVAQALKWAEEAWRLQQQTQAFSPSTQAEQFARRHQGSAQTQARAIEAIALSAAAGR